MAIAGVALILLNAKAFNKNYLVIILPLITLHICALVNGFFFQKNLNVSHHLIRFLVSAMIFIIFRKAYKR